MKKFLTCIIKSIGLVVVSVLIGLVLILLVYLIPTERIRNNLYKSEPTIMREGDGPKIWYFYSTVIDNHADIIWALMAADDKKDSLINRSLLNNWEKTVTAGELDTPVMSLHNLSSGNSEYSKQLDENNISENDTGYIDMEYSRYWHGIQLILKPLLFLFSYSIVRLISMLASTVLVIIIFTRIRKNGYKKLAFGYMLGMFSISSFVGELCLEYSMDFFVANLGVFLLIRLYESPQRRNAFIRESYEISVSECCFHLFTAIGVLTAYFSFLAYPLATLLVPLTFYIFFVEICCHSDENGKEQLSFWKEIAKIVQIGISWGIGYAGMWGGKWILASLLTDKNVIMEAMQSAAIRTNGRPVSIIYTVILNIGAYIINPLSIVILIVLLIIGYKSRIEIKRLWRHKIIYFIIMLMPILWYVVVKEHSNTHFWFTFKNMVVSVVAAFAFLEIVGIDNDK